MRRQRQLLSDFRRLLPFVGLRRGGEARAECCRSSRSIKAKQRVELAANASLPPVSWRRRQRRQAKRVKVRAQVKQRLWPRRHANCYRECRCLFSFSA